MIAAIGVWRNIFLRGLRFCNVTLQTSEGAHRIIKVLPPGLPWNRVRATLEKAPGYLGTDPGPPSPDSGPDPGYLANPDWTQAPTRAKWEQDEGGAGGVVSESSPQTPLGVIRANASSFFGEHLPERNGFIWAVRIDAPIASLLKIAVHRVARDDRPPREDLLLDRPLRDQPAEGAGLGPVWHPRAIGGVRRALLLALGGVASVPLRVRGPWGTRNLDKKLGDGQGTFGKETGNRAGREARLASFFSRLLTVLAGGGLVASRAGRLEAEDVAVQQLKRFFIGANNANDRQ
eukprot:gene7639-biopygen13547